MPEHTLRTASISLSTIALSGRLDAEFNVALQEHQTKVEGLTSRYTRDELIEWVRAFPFSQVAWQTISRGASPRKTRLPDEISTAYNETELALYLVVAAADNEACQKASDALERADRAVKAHADMRKELEEL